MLDKHIFYFRVREHHFLTEIGVHNAYSSGIQDMKISINIVAHADVVYNLTTREIIKDRYRELQPEILPVHMIQGLMKKSIVVSESMLVEQISKIWNVKFINPNPCSEVMLGNPKECSLPYPEEDDPDKLDGLDMTAMQVLEKIRERELKKRKQEMFGETHDYPPGGESLKHETLADKLIGVQPMQAPTGEIFKIKVRYSPERAYDEAMKVVKDE